MMNLGEDNGEKVKVGLALGSGAFRGLAHIGVLEVLESEGIQIDYMAGSSIGAMIGAAYCAGRTIEELCEIAINTDEKSVIDITVPRLGFLHGKKAYEFIRMLTYDKNIEDMRIPLSIVACDLDRGTKVVFTEGPAYEAIRGSISVPIVFVPHEYNGMRLVDGGVIDRVPAGVVRDMGAEMVIAVDVGYRGDPEHPKSILDIMMRVVGIGEWNLMRRIVTTADVQIIPDVYQINGSSLKQAAECIELGRMAAREMMPSIRASLAKKIRLKREAKELG